jgi:outer membrane protein assembly factor BamB
MSGRDPNAMIRSIFLVLFFLQLSAGVVGADWPMWRYDASRTASSPEELPADLHLHWWRDEPRPVPAWPEDSRLWFDANYEPVVSGGVLVFGSAQTYSVTALDTESGEVRWRYFTEGAVRLAPVVVGDAVYFGADDGYVYGVELASGSLRWKFRAAPTNRRVLGNGRLGSVWPIRGGPVAADGKLYFTAGVWPFEGAFLYTLDLATAGAGSPPESTVRTLPSMSPQGHLVVSARRLLIPSGRSPPKVFDLESQSFQSLRYGIRGLTDIHVTATEEWLFHGERAIRLEDQKLFPVSMPRPVTVGTVAYFGTEEKIAAVDVARPKVRETLGRRGERMTISSLEASWEVEKAALLAFANRDYDGGSPRHVKSLPGRIHVQLRAGSRLYGRVGSRVFGLDLPSPDAPATVSFMAELKGHPASMVAADGKLFVTTEEGRFYGFGVEKRLPRTHPLTYRPAFDPLQPPPVSLAVEAAAKVIGEPGTRDAWAIVYGGRSSATIERLLLQSDLRLLVFEPDEAVVATLRADWLARGLYGSRLFVHRANPANLALPPYLAHLVVAEEPAQWGTGSPDGLKRIFHTLRPYGGTAALYLSDAEHELLARLVSDGTLANAELTRKGGVSVLVRTGALDGAADWEHEYGDPANTLTSKERRVKAPLGVLWYGGPSSHGDLFYDRHRFPPSYTVQDGRMFIQGPEKFTAVDIYTGRLLWQIPLPGGFSPGRRGWLAITGFHYSMVEDGIYLSFGESCYRLDPVTGQELSRMHLPEPGDRWGRMRILGDLLVVSVFREVAEDVMSGYPEILKGPRGGRGELPLKLVVMNRHSGEVLWTRESEVGFPVVSASSDRVFVYESLSKDIYRSDDRRGRDPKPPAEQYLKALDLQTGEERWSQPVTMPVLWLSHSGDNDILVGSNKSGIAAWHGQNGYELWRSKAEGKGFRGHPESVWNKIIIWKNQVIDQRGPGRFLNIVDGSPILRENPVTGEATPWEFTKIGHHCNYAIACENLLTFRAGDAGFFDLNSSGTGRLSGFRTGCRNSLIPAGGILNSPNFAHGCVCGYSLFTSLAFVHTPANEQWTYSTFRLGEKAVERIGINLGAPGDRLASSGTLWVDYPSVGGPSPDLPLTVVSGEEQPAWVRLHTTQMGEAAEDELLWIAASGGEGLTGLTIPLTPAQAQVAQARAAALQAAKAETPAPPPAADAEQKAAELRAAKQRAAEEQGVYTVRLIFAELKARAARDRVFDVRIEGKPVLSDFDIAEVAGGIRRVVVREFPAVAVQGTLDITLEAKVGKPLLCGIEVVASER